jgi:ornithine cyclodeaminase/alanine dehydrogenase-like protein (mu-crystallin family)
MELKPGEILFLSRKEIESVLTARECLERCIDTFKWVGSGQVDQINPVSLWVSPPEGPFGSGFVQSYPAYVRPLGMAGCKWLGGYSKNKNRGLPVISAIDILNDAETSLPLAILDGSSVTAMRTGGHSGVGATHLAKKDTRCLAIIGCGAEARPHLMVMNEIFKLDVVRIYDIDKERAEQFRSEMTKTLKVTVRLSASAQAAIRGADLICLLTSAREPVIFEEWIDPGACICAINGFLDLDPYCAIRCDKWVVGYYARDLEWVDGTEMGKNSPPVVPYTRKDIYADLATEIIQGKRPGRENPSERIVFTHHGMPALDVAVAALAFEKAKKRGMGTVLKLS